MPSVDNLLESDILVQMVDIERSSIFLICPFVPKGSRSLNIPLKLDVPTELNILTENYVVREEEKDSRVYHPRYDIDPEDPTGGICFYERVRQIIENESTNRIDFWYNPQPKEFPFIALGMAFASGKPIILANKGNDCFVRPLPTELFGFDIYRNITFFSNTKQALEDYKRMKVINFRFEIPISKQLLFNFGMIFYLKKPIMLTNPQDVKPTDDISLNNVLISLDRETRGKN